MWIDVECCDGIDYGGSVEAVLPSPIGRTQVVTAAVQASINLSAKPHPGIDQTSKATKHVRPPDCGVVPKIAALAYKKGDGADIRGAQTGGF